MNPDAIPISHKKTPFIPRKCMSMLIVSNGEAIKQIKISIRLQTILPPVKLELMRTGHPGHIESYAAFRTFRRQNCASGTSRLTLADHEPLAIEMNRK